MSGSMDETHIAERTVKLSGGQEMPLVGLGTSPMDDATTERVVQEALELGYRLLDTAENYRNEEGVGRGLRASGVNREDVFVTTKFNVEWHGRDLARQACLNSLERLGLDYLDQLLIHWPNPGVDNYVDAWRGLLQLREEGIVRSVGVSNFKVSHLLRLQDETGELPEVNQIQLSPYIQRKEQTAFGKEEGVVSVAWSPIGKGGDLLQEPAVNRIADDLERTPAQVVLRWHLEHGHVVIPKTSRRERLSENLDLFGFQLGPDHLAELDALDQGDTGAADSDEFGH